MVPVGFIHLCEWCDRIQIGAIGHENPHLGNGTTLAK